MITRTFYKSDLFAHLDCDNCIDFIKGMPDKCVDLVVTDPPYGIGCKTNRRIDVDHDFCSCILNDDNCDVVGEFIREIYRVMKDDTAMFMFANPKNLWDYERFFRVSGFTVKNRIVWVKNNWTAGDLRGQYGQQYEIIYLAVKGRPLIRGKRWSDVWNFDRVPSSAAIHQNQKPVPLLERCIESFSDAGQFVFDPFAGSASTAIAALNTGRNFGGVELDGNEYNKAVLRLEAYCDEN